MTLSAIVGFNAYLNYKFEHLEIWFNCSALDFTWYAIIFKHSI